MNTGAVIFPYSPRNASVWAVFRDYLLTGYLLHLITLVSIYFTNHFYNLVFIHLGTGNHHGLFIDLLLLIWISSIPVFAQLDARSRYQNYKLLRDLLYRYGFRYKFVKALRHSKCQRDAAFVAAKVLGQSQLLKNYYRRCGYRWYHLLPDFILKNPFYLLTWNFWKTTFFARTYDPKYFKYWEYWRQFWGFKISLRIMAQLEQSTGFRFQSEGVKYLACWVPMAQEKVLPSGYCSHW